MPRSPRRPRPSASGSSSGSGSSSSSGSSRPKDILMDDSDYSPASEALSLSDLEENTSPSNAAAIAESDDLDLDDGWNFEPKAGDAVWVKSKSTERETWYHGSVQRNTKLGTVRGGKQGTFYMVRYRSNLRRYFAPLLGDIKPDTPHVRLLLKQAGCDVEM